MTLLSIRLVVTAICGAAIVVAGAVALAVSLSYTLDAADSYALQYVSSISTGGKRKFEDFIAVPLKKAASFQFATEQGRFPIPINKTAAERALDFQFWRNTFYTAFDETDYNLVYYGLGLQDKTYIDCYLASDPTEILCRVRDPRNITIFGDKTEYKETINVTTGNYTITWGNTSYDPTGRPWYKQVNHTLRAREWSEVYIELSGFQPIIDINAAAFDTSMRFAGVFSFSFQLSGLSRYLLELPRTANAKMVLLDNQDYLLASTVAAPVSFRFFYNQTAQYGMALATSARCTDVADQGLYFCRENIDTYGDHAFAGLKAAHGGLVATGGAQAVRGTFAGEPYFASVAAITSTGANMRWRVVTLIPDADIMGRIIDGRNYAIIFVAVVIVLCVGVSLVATWLLLRPLQRLAARMYDAASFRGADDDADGALVPSRLAEIATIQTAFRALSDQVQRARQYLPASLLAPAESADDDEEAAVDGEVSEGTACADARSSPHHDSASTSASHTQSHSQSHSATASLQHHVGDARSAASGSQRRRAAGVGAAAAAVVALRSDLGVARRKATIVYANVRGFNRRVAALGAPQTVGAYAGFVERAAELAHAHRALLDSFHGDRLVLTVNAARPCGSHALGGVAVAAGLAVGEGGAGPATFAGLAVTVGVATGALAVGNLGTDDTRRFHAIGDAFSRAVLLERLCKTFHVPVLAAEATATDAEASFRCIALDAVPVGGAVPGGATEKPRQRAPVFAVVGPRAKTAADEWMYEIAHGAGDLETRFNHAVLLSVSGDDTRAAETLATVKEALASASAGAPVLAAALAAFDAYLCGSGDDLVNPDASPLQRTHFGLALGRVFEDFYVS